MINRLKIESLFHCIQKYKINIELLFNLCLFSTSVTVFASKVKIDRIFYQNLITIELSSILYFTVCRFSIIRLKTRFIIQA
jgi:hypothetical protein